LRSAALWRPWTALSATTSPTPALAPQHETCHNVTTSNPQERLDQVLSPQSRPSQRVSGWGDYRIAVADGQVGFSWEAPGWQVMVEGMAEADAEGIVTEIAAQIGAATGQPTTSLAL
jgi:hypothetical protein